MGAFSPDPKRRDPTFSRGDLMIIGAHTGMSQVRRHIRSAIACSLALATAQTASAADTASGNNFFSDTKPIIDVRLRQEKVEQVGVVDDADAVTVRARLGFETGKLWQTSLLAEGEFVRALVDDYNDSIASHGHATFAVV